VTVVHLRDSQTNTLAWALYELAAHPEWQNKLRAELAQKDASKSKLLSAHIKVNYPN
jgi:cytochrome P450